MWAYDEFDLRLWLEHLLPIHWSLTIMSSDHWAWLDFVLDFYPFRFEFVIFGFGIEIKCPSWKFKIVNQRQRFQKCGSILRGEKADAIPFFFGIRCFNIWLSVASAWDLFNFDFDWHEWFGGIEILFLDFSWILKSKE